MERSKHFWNEVGRSLPLSSSYMTITGSGEAMQNYEDSESPTNNLAQVSQEDPEGASMNSGSGAAAGAAVTGAGGSGVA